ncbi:MAG TPA: DUF1464 family protein [Gemmatimonadaceae bacterium]|nr:DUF1464 family protein [Gemmatimonadaceae bacterium]
MPRVIGIDPGTVSIDLCGLDDGHVFLDRTLPTAEALADPAAFVAMLERMGSVDLMAGPSGYGLPLIPAAEATEEMFRLAYLAAPGEQGGIGGLRALARALAHSSLPVVFTPGVIHLPTVPAYRKVNRVDMGTADKVCAAALAVHQQRERRGCAAHDVSFLLMELGGAFTAALAVERGQIVDGVGGSAGPVGMRGVGALDGEVAFLAGTVPKSMLFRGGVNAIRAETSVAPEGGVAEGSAPEAGALEASASESFAAPHGGRDELAWNAYMEGIEKAVAMLAVAVPHPYEILLSGRMAHDADVFQELTRRLGARAPVRRLDGFTATAKEGAQGAALIADGLAGGGAQWLVQSLELTRATGTSLDYLYVITPETARRRIGL